MPVKRAIVATAAALAIAGGAALAATFPANAETPACGPNCIDLYGGIPAVLHHASFIIASYQQGQATGTPIILSDVSNSNPAEDFEATSEDPVSDYLQAGLVSPSVGQLYGDDIAFEIEYTPFGAPTGQCVGVAATATAGEQVTLQPCGVSAKTLWIPDTSASITDSLAPLINGSTQDGANPFVLTYPLGASPDDRPNPLLYLSNLQENTAGQAPYNQLWSALTGSVLRSDADLTFAQPPTITTDATSPSGATVTYPLPAATDPDDTTPPTVACSPPSGSVFPIGTTTVTCTATDRNDLNSPVHATFTITVLGAAAQLAALLQAVNGFGFDNIPALIAGIAQQQLSAGHPTLACQTLNQFITDVRLQVPASTAAPLIADAERIQAVLGGCGTRPPF
jgi:hypothetical protein